jgi:1A family penicillin-binding protein
VKKKHPIRRANKRKNIKRYKNITKKNNGINFILEIKKIIKRLINLSEYKKNIQKIKKKLLKLRIAIKKKNKSLNKKYRIVFKQKRIKSKFEKFKQKFNKSKKDFQKSLRAYLQNKKKTIKIKKKSGVIFSQGISFKSFYQAKRKYLSSFSKKSLTKLQQNFFHPIAFYLKRHPRRSSLSLGITVLIIVNSIAVYNWIFKDLPSPMGLSENEQVVTTRILDRNGNLLFRIYKDENRTLIPLSQVPEHMIQATLAIEDQDFYKHHGFSIKGIIRALIANVQGKSIQGGSTITQQLVKNRLLSSERTIRRKIREVILSILVEGSYSKEEILEMYLNQVAYGGSTYGIEEAAWRYFNKKAKNLTLAESAMLAALPAAPSVYTPFGSNPELAYTRQREVLRRMVEDDYIEQEQANVAKNEELKFRQDVIDIRAPHFVMYLKRLLAERYGEEILYEGGLEVRTTLDLALQEEVQKIVTAEVEKLAPLRVNNGASLVTNPQTGEILAMVGSKNYFDFANDGQVNVTIRPRQPGSSIKPLTYALAFEKGKTPSSTIDDSPITYSIPGSQPYSPKNYDGKYHGRVTIREALASSYNIPAVKTLASIGVEQMLDKAEEIGISTWTDRKRFGLSLTLGAGEVLMTDMAKLYATFANLGNTVDLNPFLEIKNYKGEVLYKNSCVLNKKDCVVRPTFDAQIAYQITSILADNQARTPAFGPRSVLHIPNQEVAVKTGTTNNLRDNWTIGYTTDRLVAVWVGNNDNQPMSYVASGITGASPIWNNIMLLLLDDEQAHVFAIPDGFVKLKVCSPTGTLPCKGCPVIREEIFIIGTEPKKACNPAWFKPEDEEEGENRDKILEGISI